MQSINFLVRVFFLSLLCSTCVFAQNYLDSLNRILAPTTFKSLQEALKYSDAVEILLLDNQNLVSIPEEIEKCKNLKKLSLTGNKLTKLPNSIIKLKKLVYFDVYNNQLSSLPIGFGELQALERLDIGNNKFKSIPKEIFKLTNLKELYLYGNKIRHIPDSITQLKKLQTLRLGRGFKLLWGGNCISHLPENIGEMRSLEELYLPDNALHSLPSSFAQLSRLKWLDIDHNRFRAIPPALLTLDSLQHLKIWDRGFGNAARTRFAQARPHTTVDYTRDYEGAFWAISGSIAQGNYTVAQLGLHRGYRKDFFCYGWGIAAERSLSTAATGVGLSGWVHGISFLAVAGEAGYYFAPAGGSAYLRPQVGLGWGYARLVYGYNILIGKQLSSVNHHQVAFTWVLPIAPLTLR